MRLTYKILWFEDDDGFFESLNIDAIKDHLDNKGFNILVTRMSGDEDLPVAISNAQKSDIIIMDFGLEGGHFGDQLIKEFRDGNINTDVIFYSAREVSELRRFVMEKELDGVFCRARNEIAQEVLPIIDSTIKKVLDLENSRGLVMAELGELDLIMSEIIIAYHNSSAEKQDFIRNKMKARLGDQLNTLTQAVEKFDELKIELLVEVYLDSYKRLNTMISLCKELALATHKEQLNTFHESVLFPRNCLGHGIPEETNNGFIFRHKDKEYVYNDESSTILRNSFRAFRACLEELKIEVNKFL